MLLNRVMSYQRGGSTIYSSTSQEFSVTTMQLIFPNGIEISIVMAVSQLFPLHQIEIEYFTSNGNRILYLMWRKDFIFHLFIKNIKVRNVTYRYINYDNGKKKQNVTN